MKKLDRVWNKNFLTWLTYLGDIKKGQFYFDRFNKGWLETQESSLRKFYMQALSINNDFERKNKDKMSSIEIREREDQFYLPSPTEGRSAYSETWNTFIDQTNQKVIKDINSYGNMLSQSKENSSRHHFLPHRSL